MVRRIQPCGEEHSSKNPKVGRTLVCSSNQKASVAEEPEQSRGWGGEQRAKEMGSIQIVVFGFCSQSLEKSAERFKEENDMARLI